jgi:hypothetical protein
MALFDDDDDDLLDEPGDTDASEKLAGSDDSKTTGTDAFPVSLRYTKERKVGEGQYAVIYKGGSKKRCFVS